MRSILIFFIIAFCFSAGAQQPDHKKFERKGILLGGALGVSSLRLSSPAFPEDRQMGFSLPNIKIGAMLSPRLAMLLYLPGTVYTYKWGGRQRDRGFEGIVPSVQYWAGNRLWLLGGVGLGMDAPAFYDIKDKEERRFYFGTSALAGAGYELWRKERFTLDVQGRVHYGEANTPDGKRKGLAFSILLGLNFY